MRCEWHWALAEKKQQTEQDGINVWHNTSISQTTRKCKVRFRAVMTE